LITTIIFDLAEVYLQGIIGVEHRLVPILGVEAKKVATGLRGSDLTELFHGKITEEEYWLRVIEKNNWKIDVATLKRIVRDNFTEIKGTREVIERLREKGYKLGLLSVHTREWIDYCGQKFDYHRLFDSTLYSFEVAASKPDKKVYALILKKLKSKPDECIFIDDNLKNLIPARELGITTIRFKNPAQLRKDLAFLGIDI